jgi:ketosteroid isomerase-like protein
MDADRAEFDAFLARRHAAAAQFVCGDADAFLGMVSTEHSSFFTPMGPITPDSATTLAQYTRAANFLRQGEYRFEPLASGVSGDMGWMTGIQRGSLSGTVPDRIAQLDLRVTEIFHRENGEWKLVHRHADPLKE